MSKCFTSMLRGAAYVVRITVRSFGAARAEARSGERVRGMAEIMLVYYSRFTKISCTEWARWLTKCRRNQQPCASAASARAAGTSGSAPGRPASPRRERPGTTPAGEWIPGGTINHDLSLLWRELPCTAVIRSSATAFRVGIPFSSLLFFPWRCPMMRDSREYARVLSRRNGIQHWYDAIKQIRFIA